MTPERIAELRKLGVEDVYQTEGGNFIGLLHECLDEIERLSPDAERWRWCIRSGFYPVLYGGMGWHVPNGGYYDSRSESVDRAIAEEQSASAADGRHEPTRS